MKLRKSCIHVYTGNGKGKTTAALGLALRAAGHGMRTLIIQFMKGKTNYGELQAIKNIPEITLRQFGREDFVFMGEEEEEDFNEAENALKLAFKASKDPDLSLLILDEINIALHFKLINTEDVLKLLDGKMEHIEVILTGRSAPQEIINRADLVTNMEEVKHYYRTMQLEARSGIEF